MKLDIVFIGSVDFSHHTLKRLIELDSNIVGVLTKKTSPFNSDFFDISPICKKNKIDYKYVNNINDKENINWIKSCKPDIIFCFGWSYC